MKSEKTRNLIIALIWATSITLLCALGVFRSPELWLQDKLYQKPVYVSDDIVIIGIDENDIKEFGPTNSWDRWQEPLKLWHPTRKDVLP